MPSPERTETKRDAARFELDGRCEQLRAALRHVERARAELESREGGAPSRVAARLDRLRDELAAALRLAEDSP
jgi:hypothetical protein